MRQVLVAIAAALLPLAASAAENLVANLVADGSFEDYAQARNTWSIYTSGDDWSTGAKGVEVRNAVAGTAADGLNFVELDTTQNSSIFQDIDTVAGEQYLLSFSYSNRTGVSLASNGLSWSFGSFSGAAPELAYNSSGNNQWSTFTVEVTATSSLTRLSFSATGISDSYGSSLDHVQLFALSPVQQPLSSVVPEPASASLALAGLALLGAAARRRRHG